MIIGLLFTLALAANAPEDVLNAYAKVGGLLADDKIAEAKTAAGDLREKAGKLKDRDKGEKIQAGADKLAKAATPKAARAAFGTISEAAVEMVKKDADLKKRWTLMRCPMAPKYKMWLQAKADASKLMNPYFGHEMQQCGNEQPWE